MKFFFSYLFFLLTVCSFAQRQKSSQAVINLRTDILQTNALSRTGAAIDDAADAIALGLHRAADTKVLYLPKGIYRVKKSISLFRSGLHIKGDGMGKTIILTDTSYVGNNALFQSNGASNITIEGITFTGNQKPVKAVLEFNSYPNRCKNIRILQCEFVNLWAKQAINFGGMSEGEEHSNDNVLISGCRFQNICHPSYVIVANDTDPKCDGINLQQTTLRATIQYCTFQKISGDGIFGWGWSDRKKKADALYGNWNIHHNSFSYCWMGIEVNGGGLGSNLNIHDNVLKYSTRNGGYLISVDSYKARIVKNTLYNIDRGLIEYTAIEGIISNNTGTITTYKENSAGIRSSIVLPRINCLELYGYNNTITRNKFLLNRSQPDAFSPQEFNGISIVGKTTDKQTQPLSYKGITDFSAYWVITNNSISGFTHKVIDASNDMIRNVTIRNNLFTSRDEQKSPVEIYGYGWRIENNTFNLTGSKPRDNNFVVTVFYLQKDATKSFVSSNTILGDSWNSADHKYGGKIR